MAIDGDPRVDTALSDHDQSGDPMSETVASLSNTIPDSSSNAAEEPTLDVEDEFNIEGYNSRSSTLLFDAARDKNSRLMDLENNGSTHKCDANWRKPAGAGCSSGEMKCRSETVPFKMMLDNGNTDADCWTGSVMQKP